jgi:hypothetical protein
MNLSRLCGAIITFSFLTIQADANPITLYTLANNFPLDGGGGGDSATLNNYNNVPSQNIEMFCDDFAHNIWVPYGPPVYTGYTVNVSNITAGGLGSTRFGGVTSWTSVNIAGDATDSNTINNATTALARYQMAAYLTMQYHVLDNPSNNAYNNGIQEAIWTILDPTMADPTLTSPAPLPNIGDPTSALKQAAQWYANPNSDKSFLASFRIIGEASMYNCVAGGPLCSGFQEQLFDPPTTPTVPEPRGQLLVILGLLSLCAFKYQRSWKRS